MEQQTVSIAKAGISTTLNARTSILAAANPLYGRYNRKQSINKNINMPAALLSRFDLVFLLIDEYDKDIDLQLARHIGYVHRTGKAPTPDTFDPSFLRAYIALAKQHNPIINPTLHSTIIESYIRQRKEQNLTPHESFTTPRTLLALIRLCQARARLRFSNEVTMDDVHECMRIQNQSQKITAEEPTRKKKFDTPSEVFEIIKNLCLGSEDRKTNIDLAMKIINNRGYTREDFDAGVSEYVKMNVLFIEANQIILIENR